MDKINKTKEHYRCLIQVETLCLSKFSLIFSNKQQSTKLTKNTNIKPIFQINENKSSTDYQNPVSNASMIIS